MNVDYTQIVEGCKRHDRRWQKALYDLVAPMAMGVCMRYSDCRETAQDWMQDGMIRIFEQLPKLHQPETLMGWAYRVMVNTCIDRFRVRKVTVDIVDGNEQPVTHFDDPFMMHDIAVALQRLTPAQRLAFNLVEVEDMDYAEAAARMKCTEVNVRSLLSKAKQQLRVLLLDKDI